MQKAVNTIEISDGKSIANVAPIDGKKDTFKSVNWRIFYLFQSSNYILLAVV